MTPPIPGPGRPYHPGQFPQPASEQVLEHARAAVARLEVKARPKALRPLNRLGLRRSARKGGHY